MKDVLQLTTGIVVASSAKKKMTPKHFIVLLYTVLKKITTNIPLQGT